MPAITKLEAVNQMLRAIGEQPVSSLTSGVLDAEQAEVILGDVSKEIQAKGWPWNRDEKIRLVPNNDDEVVLPANTLNIDPAYTSAHLDYVVRGDKLYDRKNQTFTITSPVYVDLITEFDFEDLPYALAKYISARAARLFQEGFEGSLTLDAFSVRQEQEAKAALDDATFEVDDANVLLDSPSVYQIAYRRNSMWGR